MAENTPTTKPSSSSNGGSRLDQARAAVGSAAAKTRQAAGKTARRAGDAVAGKGKMIAATAGVVAATAAGVVAVKAIRARKSGGGNGRVYHVQPRGEDWQVTVDGNERASGTYGTKKQAITAGRTMAQKHEPSRLIIHAGDGAIQRTHTYGDD
jgi:hypothetical protein